MFGWWFEIQAVFSGFAQAVNGPRHDKTQEHNKIRHKRIPVIRIKNLPIIDPHPRLALPVNNQTFPIPNPPLLIPLPPSNPLLIQKPLNKSFIRSFTPKINPIINKSNRKTYLAE